MKYNIHTYTYTYRHTDTLAARKMRYSLVLVAAVLLDAARMMEKWSGRGTGWVCVCERVWAWVGRVDDVKKG